jgi:hypothetical protein
MRRLFAGFIVSLILLFSTAIGLIRAQPYIPDALDLFLTPPPGCKVPCFMGVQPGQTTVEQALAILRANDAITQVQVRRPYYAQHSVNWRWVNDLEHYEPYSFVVEAGRIVWPSIPWEAWFTIPHDTTLGDVQLILGEPARVTATRTNDYLERATFVLEYPRRGLYLLIRFHPCIIKQESFWQMRQQNYLDGSFTLGLGEPNYAFSVPGSRVALDTDTWANQLRDFCWEGR